MKNILRVFFATAILLSCVISTSVYAEYPDRPVKFIVPWPPGDIDDLMARLIAEEMSKETGKPATVVNKPGGGAAIGTLDVARSKPDGLTIGVLVNDLLTFKVLAKQVPWDFDTFEPVGIFVDFPFIIATSASAPYNTMEELAEYSKTHDVSLGHFGYQASPTAITFEAAKHFGISFSSDAPFDMIDCSTLANGDADVVNTSTQLILACLKSGDAKVLTSLTRERISLIPNVPTLNEISGIPHTTWGGLFVPKGTPKSIKDKIASIAQKVVLSDKAKESADVSGSLLFWQDSEEAKERINKEIEESKTLLSFLR